jgi:hypothetical protein
LKSIDIYRKNLITKKYKEGSACGQALRVQFKNLEHSSFNGEERHVVDVNCCTLRRFYLIQFQNSCKF